MKVKCIVSCRSADGVPTFYPCVVNCTQDEYDDGDHYDTASDLAVNEGHEDTGLVYDENDGPEFLFQHYFENK